MMQQPPHFKVEDTFNYPMIPFCWFGAPLHFIGHNVADLVMLSSYNSEIHKAGSDLEQLLRWCDVFRPAFPVKSNCYSVGGIVPKGAGMLKSVRYTEEQELLMVPV